MRIALIPLTLALLIPPCMAGENAPLSTDAAALVARVAPFSEHAENLRRLTEEGGRLELAPFDDVRLDLDIRRVVAHPEGADALGLVNGSPHSAVTLVRRGDILVGSIHAPGVGDFDLRTAADGALVLRELSVALASCGAASQLRPALENARGDLFCPSANTLAGYACDDGSTVDLMVVYTAAARDVAGGDAQINALIDLSAAIANQAFTDSQVGVQLRVVRKALIAYAETGAYSLDLPRLTEIDDGFLDSVHADRDIYGADLVYLWVNNLDTGGAAFSLGALFPQDDGRWGFGVMRQDNAAFETLAHETGHNFGCAHDRDNSFPGDGFFNYSYGYREPGGVWKTIMAYPPGTTIYNFSNPDQTYTGPLGNPGPMGTPGDDPDSSCNNTLTINNTRFTVANFRPSTITPTPPARLYVRPAAPPGGNGASWASAMQDVQTAIATAVRARGAVSEIWVAAGLYKPDAGSGERVRSFRLANGVTLYGGFAGTETSLAQRNPAANVTVLSGDIGLPGVATDNSYHVLDVDDLDASAVIDGFTITGGQADGFDWPYYAGGAMLARCSAATVRNCRFAGNYAIYGGAAWTDYGATVTFINTTFIDNSADQLGGAVGCPWGGPSFVGCRFENNLAPYGGAASVDGAVLFTDCEFIANTAMNNGGAIDGGHTAASVCTGCLFQGNSAEWAGAISNTVGSITLQDCDFVDNESFSGGAVASLYGAVLIENSHFINNLALYGGAILTDDNLDVRINNCEFTMNSAEIGGALYQADQPILRDCSFTQNVAFSTGGATAFDGGPALFVRCAFNENEAPYGGAVTQFEGGTAEFVNCGFFGNRAQFSSGAMENYVASATLTNCIFSGNQAIEGDGGGLSNVLGGDMTLNNCTIVNNSAGWSGGGIATDPPHVTLNNCLLWGNTHAHEPGETAQLFHYSDPPSLIQSSTLQGWSGAYGGTANNGLNPLFVDANGPDNIVGTPDDDLGLSPGSPAIDSGANVLVPADSGDLDGDANLGELTPRDYADGPRFVDDPAVADTGIGTAPLVDRGAREAAPPSCTGDLDGDGAVGLADLAIQLSNYGVTSGAAPEDGDMDGDGDVDLTDLAVLLAAYGSSCE